MAADYTYDPGLVFNDVTMEPARLVVGTLCNANDLTTPLQVYDLNGSPLSTLQTNEEGYVARFRADVSDGIMRFGDTLQPVASVESQRAGLTAKSDAAGAVSLAQEALAQAQASSSGRTQTIVQSGSGYPVKTFPSARWLGVADPRSVGATNQTEGDEWIQVFA